MNTHCSASYYLLFLVVFINCCAIWVLGISGGTMAQNHPFFVQIEKIGQSLADRQCGGSIVTPNLVLTAAHCLFDSRVNNWIPASRVRVLKSDFSRPNWRQGATDYSCESYFIHKFYNHKTIARGEIDPFDIAAIEVKHVIDLRQPGNGIIELCLPFGDYSPGFAIGLGLLQMSPHVEAEVLMETKLHFDYECGIYKYPVVESNRVTQLCYGLPGKVAGTCRGDCGGPIIHREGTKMCLIGVASYCYLGCDDPNYPSVFTKASYFEKWIEDVLMFELENKFTLQDLTGS